MDSLTFSLACRSCLTTDPRHWSCPGDELGQPYLQDSTDFRLMLLVEDFGKDRGVVCLNCGSSALDVLDLAVNDRVVFDYYRVCQERIEQGLAMITVTLNKVAHVLSPSIAGNSPDINGEFVVLALHQMAELVAHRPPGDFIDRADGRFVFAVSGLAHEPISQGYIRGEKYACQGFTRQEVVTSLLSLRDHYHALIQ